MNEVQPIRHMKTIEKIKKDLKGNNYRDYLLFLLGINTGMRISDLLSLKIKDVVNQEYIIIREKKTRKTRKYKLTSYFIRELQPFLEGKKINDYLFQARYKDTPISRMRAYKIIKKACESHGLRNIGTHSLRKTFGYHILRKSGRIERVMIGLGHRHEKDSLRYIGTTQDVMDNIIESLEL